MGGVWCVCVIYKGSSLGHIVWKQHDQKGIRIEL